jgi:hypothetical protein
MEGFSVLFGELERKFITYLELLKMKTMSFKMILT